MRPWHEPGGLGQSRPCQRNYGFRLLGIRWRNHRRLNRTTPHPPHPAPAAARLRAPRAPPAGAAHQVSRTVPPPYPQAQSSHRRSALAADSNGSTTVDNQPFFADGTSAPPRARPHAPPFRAPAGRAFPARAPEVPRVARARRPAPEGPVRRSAREMARTSRAGPPPAGNGAAVSPSPPSPVRRADPRRVHGSASTAARRERTAGRTATRPGHIRHPSPPPPAPRAATARPPARATIPPSEPMPLNGRDAENYAGFTDGLSTAAYSSGFGHMRVRPASEVRREEVSGTNAARRPR